ncbi:hypothetical protein HZS_6712, partial [Henneguya salminicola]
MSTDNLNFVKAIFIIRPIEENIILLSNELNRPRFEKYFLFFTNTLSNYYIDLISKSDSNEVVAEIQEMFLDYYPLDSYIFSTKQLIYRNKYGWIDSSLTRCSEAVFSLLLSLKVTPHIRYQKSSKLSQDLGNLVHAKIVGSQLNFDISDSKQKNLLLILERNFDPITPLLLQWTYQAMIHELLTIKNNIVNLSTVPDIHPDFHEILLSPELDKIFHTNMFLNFSEVASNIKSMVSEFQALKKDKQKLESLTDIKAVVDSYPIFRKITNYISRHVTIASELNNIAKNNKHREQSEFEQNLLQKNDLIKPYIDILLELIRNPAVTTHDATRLTLIYLICQPKIKTKDKKSIFEALKNKGIDQDQTKAIEYIYAYCFNDQSSFKFVGNENTAFSATKRYFRNILQVEESESQHKPIIEQVVSNIIKLNTLNPIYPLINDQNEKNFIYTNIIIFIVGGFTYEESVYIHEKTKSSQYKILLGGTTVHNSTRCLFIVVNFQLSSRNHSINGIIVLLKILYKFTLNNLLIHYLYLHINV